MEPIVVDASGRGAVCNWSDNAASLGSPSASDFDFANDSQGQQFGGLVGDRTAAHLATLLDDATVLLRGADDGMAFIVDV